MICVCLRGKTLSEWSKALVTNSAYADMLELRFDCLNKTEQNLAELELWMSHCKLPCIFTIREVEDGGYWIASEEEKDEIITRALQSKRFYAVDVEAGRPGTKNEQKRKTRIKTVFHLIQKHALQTRVIISEHYFESDRKRNTNFIEKDFLNRLQDLSKQYPDAVIKYALQCHSSFDFLCFLTASKSLQKSTRDYVLIPMGNHGQAARIIPNLGLSVWTYSSSEDSLSSDLKSTALGQLSAKTLHSQYRYHELQGHDARLPVFAVVGNPVMHSQSPSFFNTYFAKQNIQALYVHLLIDKLNVLPEIVEQLHIQGMSITIPHKEQVISYLQKKDEAVRSCSAANTVVCTKGAWEGYNTDVLGFLLPLIGKLNLDNQSTDLETYRNSLRGIRCTLLGAGGAARAILFALVYCGASVLIANRTLARARSLAAMFPESQIQTTVLDDYHTICAYSNLIVNSTSIGMKSNKTPLPNFPFEKKQLVYDIVYTPLMTQLLTDARTADASIITGDKMFHTQASLQADLFLEQMRKIKS